MSLALNTPPSNEPVSLAEAKAYLRIDHADEDALIQSLLLAARMHLERVTGLAFLSQQWSLWLDHWPGPEVTIPLFPLAAVVAVKIYPATGAAAVADPATYVTDTARRPPRLVRVGATWPEPQRVANGIEIVFTAGFGANAADLPAPLAKAILLLAADWYETRGPLAIGDPAESLPRPVAGLIAPYRTRRLT